MIKLYVGNLSFETTEHVVRDLFASHGVVETCSLVRDRDSGRPLGFAFVQMSNRDAARARQALNGAFLEGRQLTVNEARSQPSSRGGRRGASAPIRYR